MATLAPATNPPCASATRPVTWAVASCADEDGAQSIKHVIQITAIANSKLRVARNIVCLLKEWRPETVVCKLVLPAPVPIDEKKPFLLRKGF
jgi:deoxyribose-phosphate aldolase